MYDGGDYRRRHGKGHDAPRQSRPPECLESQASRPANDTGPPIVGEVIERARWGAACCGDGAGPTGTHAVGCEKAASKHYEADQRCHEVFCQREGESGNHHDNPKEQDITPPKARGESGRPSGAYGTGQIGQENEAHQRGGKSEWFTVEPEYKVVIKR